MHMLKIGLVTILTLANVQASACSCSNPGRSLWQSTGVAHLVRIEQVNTGMISFAGRSDCSTNPDYCYRAQIAQYVELERIGNGPPLPTTLVSGFGGGDCGLPLLAGTVFVVFGSSPGGQVGICNALGPYRDEDLNPERGAELLSFIDSLRQAAARPDRKVMEAPKPIQMNTSAFPPPPPPPPPPSTSTKPAE